MSLLTYTCNRSEIGNDNLQDTNEASKPTIYIKVRGSDWFLPKSSITALVHVNQMEDSRVRLCLIETKQLSQFIAKNQLYNTLQSNGTYLCTGSILETDTLMALSYNNEVDFIVNDSRSSRSVRSITTTSVLYTAAIKLC